MNKRKDCEGVKFCGNVRRCERCARARSAEVAGVAELIEQELGGLFLTVARPLANSAEALRLMRDDIMRRELAPAGIWTVETGELFAGLHLNIISLKDLDRMPKQYQPHTERIRTSARNVAAYISKRTGMPSAEQYRGRLWGAWGVPTVGQIIAANNDAPVVQAAAVQMALEAPAVRLPYREAMRLIGERQKREAEQEAAKPQELKPMEYHREIARRRLAAIYEALGRVEK